MDQTLGYSTQALIKSFWEWKIRIPGSPRDDPRPARLFSPDKHTLSLVRHRRRGAWRCERHIESLVRVGEVALAICLDETGGVVGLDIDQASGKLDLSTLETIALPLGATRAA